MHGQGRPSTPPGDLPLAATEHGLARRRFLIRMGVFSAGAIVLCDWSPGCSSNSTAPRPRGDGTGGLDPFATPRNQDGTLEPPAPLIRPSIPREEPIARVRIASARAGSGRLEIAHPSGRIQVREGMSLRSPQEASSPISVTRRGGRWDVVDRAGNRVAIDGARPVDLLAPAGSAANLRFEGGEYAGMFRCAAVANDQGGENLDLVNYVPLEAYLPGVLSKELYSSWHARTFEAQAIAARSFAAAEIQHFAERRHYDLTNTQQSQVYGGATTLAVAVNGVKATRGRVLSWENTLVPAYYSSCCGGVASSAAEEIGSSFINDIPPLKARSGPNACTQAPVYRWRVERTVEDISARLRAWAAENGEPALARLSEAIAIAPGSLNPFGRPTSIVITGARGERVEIASRKFREAANVATGALSAPAKILRSSFITASFTGGMAIFDGCGYGHGAGMCQYCAQALAQRGAGVEEMLAMFYPGAAVVSAYV
jgi:stage II sporulation protein D